MANLGTLYAQIGLDTSTLAAGQMRAENIFGAIKNSAIRLGAVVGLALGGREVIRGVESLIDSAATSEQVFNRLKTAVETTGVSYDAGKGQLVGYTQEMMKTTRYSDEEVAESLQMITQLTGNVAKGLEGSKIAADMASSGLFDLQSAGKYVSMAMEGNVMMLARWIPQLRDSAGLIKENMTATEKWAVTKEILNRMFGGSAQKDLNTYAGALQSLKNWIDEVKEAAGRVLTVALAPKFREWKDAIIAFIESGKLEEWCTRAEVWVKKLMDAIITGATWVWEHKDYLVAMFKALVAYEAVLTVIKVAGAMLALAKSIEAATLAASAFNLTKLGGALLGAGGGALAGIITVLGSMGAGWYYIADAAGSAAKKEAEAAEAADAYGKALIKSGAYANYLQAMSKVPILPGIEVTAERIKGGGVAGEITAGAQKQLDTENWLSDARRELWALDAEENRKFQEQISGYVFVEGDKRLTKATEDAEKALGITTSMLGEWEKAHKYQAALYQSMANAAGTAFHDILMQAKSFNDIMKSFWNSLKESFVNMLADMVTEWIKKQMEMAAMKWGTGGIGGIIGWIGSLFEEGGLVTMQTGGFIGQRFALAETGEYVIPERTVSKIGIPAFEYMRQTGELPARGGGDVYVTTGDFVFGQRYKRREAMALKDEFVDVVSDTVKTAIDKGKLRL